MDSLLSLSNPPQQPVPSNEGWDTQQSKILQGMEHACSGEKGRKGRGGGDGRERKGIEEEWGSEDRGSERREGRGGRGN